MKKESINQFTEGMNLDLHPMFTPNSVLTDNLNGTFITYNGNEFCLQNDKGNKQVASLREGFVPIGAKEYNGVIYIVSVKNEFAKDPETGELLLDENGNPYVDPANTLTEIGTYPGIDWSLERDPITGEAEGHINYELYTPLGNFNDGDFRTLGLNYTTINPVTIEIQPSYDGSVNMIITDGVNPVRMVNSAFSVLPNDKYRLIKRNQSIPTNYYTSDKLEDLTLIRMTNVLTNVELDKVVSGGQLKGGNYTFYIKFGDGDYNQTDVIAESGIISIFKGNDCTPSTISGTVLDERTDKMIGLKIIGLNKSYSKIYIYFSREYSDTQGYRLTEYGVLKDPIDISSDNDEQLIWITGYEQTQTISSDEINIDYHTFDSARAEAQQKNMLFLGNLKLEETNQLYTILKNVAASITCNIKQRDPMDAVNYVYNSDVVSEQFNSEYYSTKNIYNYLGYWPNEWYRFGVVFILKDGSTTPVFNMPGNVSGEQDGVFRTPNVKIFEGDKIKPIYFEFKLTGGLPDNVLGYFYVRQKRIPSTICQGLSIGIDQRSHLPVTWNGNKWITQSFLSLNRFDYVVDQNHNWEPSSGQDARRKDLQPILQYTSTKTSPVGSSMYGEEYNGIHVMEGLIVRDIREYSSLEELQNDFPIYDSDGSELNATSTIYVYTMQRYWRYSSAGNSYQLVTPNGTSAPTLYCYYVTTSNPAPTFIWFRNQLSGLTCNSGDTSTCLQIALAHNSKTDADSSLKTYPPSVENKYIAYPETYGSEKVAENALLSLDPCVNNTVSSMLDGSEFVLIPEYGTDTYFGTENTNAVLKGSIENGKNTHIWEKNKTTNNNQSIVAKCAFVKSDTKVKELDGYAFSNIAGSDVDVSQYAYSSYSIGITNNWRKNRSGRNNDGDAYRYLTLTDDYNAVIEREIQREDLPGKVGFNSILNVNILRGHFTPFIGINKILSHGLWSIRLKDTSDENALIVRKQDESPYFAVSNRTNNVSTDVYRGDCFTNTVSMRIIRNFVDPEVPISDNIIDFDGWDYHVRRWGDRKPEEDNMKYIEWNEVNRADVNTVDLGYWVTYKCLSSYNLGLRSENTFYTDEMALLGSPRSFYPLNSGSIATGNKMEESFLLNDGYSATVGEKVYDLLPDVPYSKSEFANRIIFSNVQVESGYTNGYRVFQGLSFKDYDKQYGEIVKLISLDDGNLLVVMEHGVGIVGVNEKALIQTTTGDAVHIYGQNVLSDDIYMKSTDYGSKYEHSVIRTPIGVYGIDTDARKIWRYNTQRDQSGSTRGFETLSDMKIESYLNDELGTNKSIDLPLFDVRTHYNATKGDLMFTFFKKLFGKKETQMKKRSTQEPAPRTIVKQEEAKYFNINTSEEVLSINKTDTRAFTTNLTESEVNAIVNDTNIAQVQLDFENKKLTITALDAGGTQVEIAGKTIPIRVKSLEEEKSEKQKEISQITETEITEETVIDEDTGEETVVPVVVSKMQINSNIFPWTMYVGDTYNISITFKNNAKNVTLSDCEIDSHYSDGGSALIDQKGNVIQVTPQSEGKWRFGVSYPGARGFDTGWITFEKKVFWVNLNGMHGDGDVIDVTAPINNYFELTAYGNNSGKVTISGFDNSIVDGGITESTSRIWFSAMKVGDTTAIITDTGSGDSVTVNLHVISCVNITDAQFYSGNTPINELTMRVGETKRITWKYVPEYHPGNTNVLSAGLRLDKPTVYDKTRPTELQVANASYSLGSCYTNITARQAGTIVWTVFISPAGGGKVTYVDLPITVIDE